MMRSLLRVSFLALVVIFGFLNANRLHAQGGATMGDDIIVPTKVVLFYTEDSSILDLYDCDVILELIDDMTRLDPDDMDLYWDLNSEDYGDPGLSRPGFDEYFKENIDEDVDDGDELEMEATNGATILATWGKSFTRTDMYVLANAFDLTKYVTQDGLPDDDRLRIAIDFENAGSANKACVVYAKDNDVGDYHNVAAELVEGETLGIVSIEFLIDKEFFLGSTMSNTYDLEIHIKSITAQDYEDPADVKYLQYLVLSPSE